MTVPEDKQEYTRRKHKRHQENEPKDNQEYTVTEPKQRRQGRKERVTKKFAIEMKQWNERVEVLNKKKKLDL